MNTSSGRTGWTKYVINIEPCEHEMSTEKIVKIGGRCPLLKTPYFVEGYTDNYLKKKNGEFATLSNLDSYVVELDEKSGLYRLKDDRFLRTYYILPEYIKQMYTVTPEGPKQEENGQASIINMETKNYKMGYDTNNNKVYIEKKEEKGLEI